MKKHPERKIFRSLCKTHKREDGGVNWAKVADELRKLPHYKTRFKQREEVCETCGQKLGGAI